MMLNKEAVQAQEEVLRLHIRELPDEKRKLFYAMAKKELKDPDTFAVLNYLFITGLHHFYLRKWLRGALNLLAIFLALVLWIGGFLPVAMLLLLLLWGSELYALFRSQVIVQDYNNKVMERTLHRL